MPVLLSLVAAAALATTASPHAEPTPATPVREIAPGILLVDARDRDMTMPSLSVTPGDRPADGARSEWAITTRCDPRGHMEDGNLCVQYFVSGLKVPIRAPYVNRGAVLPRLKTVDGATLSTLEITTYGRTLPDGSRIEGVDVESELATRLKSPWGSESIYPHLYLQELVGGTCNCVAGLRRVAANGQVLWAWSYYWHPRGDAEASGKAIGDPVPEPLIAFNEFAVPQRGSVALASSTATLFGHVNAGAGADRRWPKLIVSIDVETGEPTSHLRVASSVCRSRTWCSSPGPTSTNGSSTA